MTFRNIFAVYLGYAEWAQLSTDYTEFKQERGESCCCTIRFGANGPFNRSTDNTIANK